LVALKARWMLAGLAVFCVLFSCASAATADVGGRTWWVRAGAAPGGWGSRAHPFDSLAAVEAASLSGDRIVVLPAAVPLDGGIALKPDQQLVGAGPAVTDATQSTVPAITNSSAARYGGDAVVLADDTEVRNVRIVDAYTAGVVGRDVSRALLSGDVITGFNRSEGVGATGFLGLEFGNAGIDVRAAGDTRSDLTIRGTTVADADGNGSIFRTADTARLDVHLIADRFHDLRVASSLPADQNFGFVEAVFFDSAGASRFHLHADRLFVDTIGTGTASNADAIFSTNDGSSRQLVDLRHYTFRDTSGTGGPRSSGGEYVTGIPTAVGSQFALHITDSDIRDAQAEGVQLDDFGTSEQVSLDIRHTLIQHTGLSTTPDLSEHPFGTADCVEITPREPATGSTYRITLVDDHLLGCTGNGIQIWNGPATLTTGTVARLASMSLNLRHDVIAGNGRDGLFLNDIGSIDQFSLAAERTSVIDNANGVELRDTPLGTTTSSTIDLGGGSLGSPGLNRIFGNHYDVVANDNFQIAARNDWWGSPSGPDPAGTLLQDQASLDSTPFLTADPGS
jgi:hypothetical protein